MGWVDDAISSVYTAYDVERMACERYEPCERTLRAWQPLKLKCCFTSTETVGLLRTRAQDVHPDFKFNTAPEHCMTAQANIPDVPNTELVLSMPPTPHPTFFFLLHFNWRSRGYTCANKTSNFGSTFPFRGRTVLWICAPQKTQLNGKMAQTAAYLNEGRTIPVPQDIAAFNSNNNGHL